jgi:hypothetical protein
VDTAAGTDLTPPVVEAVRSRVEGVLRAELRARRNELSALDPSAAVLVEELERLLAAGGKRLRPAFTTWGTGRPAGGRGAGRARRGPWNCCTRSRSCTTT